MPFDAVNYFDRGLMTNIATAPMTDNHTDLLVW